MFQCIAYFMVFDVMLGTLSYMAPEVVYLYSHLHISPTYEYGTAVDCFSLGILIFNMLTGHFPFQKRGYKEIELVYPKVVRINRGDKEKTHLQLFGAANIQLLENLKLFVAADLVRTLLSFNPLDRDCCFPIEGQQSKLIHEHQYFHGIDWKSVEEGLMKPPYLPSQEDIAINERFRSFDNVMREHHCAEWIAHSVADIRDALGEVQNNQFVLNAVLQHYFDNWNYVSPTVIEAENRKLAL